MSKGLFTPALSILLHWSRTSAEVCHHLSITIEVYILSELFNKLAISNCTGYYAVFGACVWRQASLAPPSFSDEYYMGPFLQEFHSTFSCLTVPRTWGGHSWAVPSVVEQPCQWCLAPCWFNAPPPPPPWYQLSRWRWREAGTLRKGAYWISAGARRSDNRLPAGEKIPQHQ